MHSLRRFLAVLALTVTSAILITILPLSSLAAPQGVFGTPVYLPIVLKNFPQTPTPTPTATATPTATSTPTIPITVGPVIGLSEQFVFSPVTITVHVGDVVRWTWGSSGHTVTSGTTPNADNQFCSPSNTDCATPVTSNTGATFDHAFLAPGTYPYFCQIHWSIGMTGTVVVLP